MNQNRIRQKRQKTPKKMGVLQWSVLEIDDVVNN